ncbi:MAG: ATP-binding protein [Chloroflexi bacterium]|nr:ATP-binding protein [Chloroflexota bacterium]
MTDSFEDFLKRDVARFPDAADEQRLGVVVGGSLSRGLVVRVDGDRSIEDLAVGRYVVVHGERARFFCIITDVALQNANPAIQNDPPDMADPFLRQVYIGTAAYGTVNVAPMLMIDENNEARPVKTIPGHFMRVHNATDTDVNHVFGADDDKHFNIGAPLELEHTQINIELKRLVERSIGVFGKSGTGKTYLTRVILAGMMARRKSVNAVNLVFDMHTEYGWAGTAEHGAAAKGLRQLFPSHVVIVTLDEESSRRRGAGNNQVVRIPYDDIEPEDFVLLKGSMNLTDAMLDATNTLSKLWGRGWIKRLIDADRDDLAEVTEQSPVAEGTLLGLKRRVERFERWDFLTDQPVPDSVKEIINLLAEQRKSVILEFGRYGNSVDAYILVANYITRRIHEHYVEKVERALGDPSLEPPHLVITIEEAHKFLDPGISDQTIFGIIARELRKYKVTLLVVDQRPSGIDEEVMSQIGTRVTALLDNERDISAVLNGVSGAANIREVLARLDTKQQAIIMGHAVPMPVVIKARTYDQDFYAAVSEDMDDKSLNESRMRLGRGSQRRL